MAMVIVESSTGRQSTMAKQSASGEADGNDDGEGQEDTNQRQRKERNPDDILARRRFENIRKHSAKTRHWTGIINNGEKNRFTIAEKQLDKAHRVAEAKIYRMKEQLRRELNEMEAGKRALRARTMCVRDEDRDRDRQNLAKYCHRGRYLYAIRNETKSQKDDMKSYNGRLEKAKKLLQTTRRLSTIAMDNGKLLGQAPSHSYMKVGRRVSVVEAPEVANLFADADGDHGDDGKGDIKDAMKTMLARIKLQKPNMKASLRAKTQLKTPPPFNVHQLRKEFCPELRKELELLMMDDPSITFGPMSRGNTRESRRPAPASHVADMGGDEDGTDAVADANRPDEMIKLLDGKSSHPVTNMSSIPGTEAQLKLPSVQTEKSLVCRMPKTHKPPAASKQILSTVAET